MSDPVISRDNIHFHLSNVLQQFSGIKLLTRKPKEYYLRQYVDSKNSADLRLQVDASADRTSPSALLDHCHVVRYCDTKRMIYRLLVGYDMNPTAKV